MGAGPLRMRQPHKHPAGPGAPEDINDHHVVPTYLLTYPVTQDEKAAAVFQDLLDAGRCEIGMHCHPWNTPPYQEVMNRYNSMLCNLPASLQLEKLQRLLRCSTADLKGHRWPFGAVAGHSAVELPAFLLCWDAVSTRPILHGRHQTDRIFHRTRRMPFPPAISPGMIRMETCWKFPSQLGMGAAVSHAVIDCESSLPSRPFTNCTWQVFSRS